MLISPAVEGEGIGFLEIVEIYIYILQGSSAGKYRKPVTHHKCLQCK
jgi:hypothetical protein